MKHTRRAGAINYDDPTDHLSHLRPPDHGTDGPAQEARPSSLAETIQAGRKYRQMEDSHPIDVWDRTAQLTERQINAAWELTRKFRTGFPDRAVTPAYGASRGHDGSVEAAVAMTQARRAYDKLMERVPPECRHVLQRMVRGEYPGISGGLQLVRRGTDALADEMRLPRVVLENGKGWRE